MDTTSFESYCEGFGPFCAAYFSNSFLSKASLTYKNYTSSNGTKGKEIVYAAKYGPESNNSGNLGCSDNSSTGTLTIAAIPKGNSWLIDYVDPASSTGNITCKPYASS